MDPVLLRAVERLLVVVFAGMAIYLGYRLFLAVPTQQDADGKVLLPGGTEVVLSRVGPGAFFALFGSITLGLSLFYRVEVTPVQPLDGAQAGVPTPSYVGFVQTSPGTHLEAPPAVDPDVELGRMRALFFTLNELADGSTATGSDAARQERDLRQTKLRLLQSLWLPQWGDFDDFTDWAATQEAQGEPPDPRFGEPAALFHQGHLP